MQLQNVHQESSWDEGGLQIDGGTLNMQHRYWYRGTARENVD